MPFRHLLSICSHPSGKGHGRAFATGLLIAGLAGVAGAGTTPYARAGALKIGGVKVVSGAAHRMARVELTINIGAAYDNPFDSSEVALDARIVAPSGRTITVPGFLYQRFRRTVGKTALPIAYASTEALARGAAKERTAEKGEVLVATGAPEWRVRFTPMETGLYRTTLVLRDRTGTVRKAGPAVRVAASVGKASGFVGIDKGNPRAFRLSEGRPFYPIGANVGWAGERGTRDYDDWLPAYGKAGCNWGRVWLSPSWTTFALERPGRPDEGKGLGQFDLANAWRLDYTLDLAARNGIYLDLCVDSYNMLRDRINWPEWERSVFNVSNGGPLTKPLEFWTNADARRRYRDKLRYLVARWGADPHVFAWEFWNEVDGVTDYKVGPVGAWHEEMSRYLRDLDPYDHLVSTSFGGNGAGAGDAKIFDLPGIDFSVSHLYEATDMALSVSAEQRRLGALGKPHFVAEAGADTKGARGEDDPEGLQLHDPLWASIASGDSGGAMLWWWDSYIHPRNLYGLFPPVVRFLNGIDWGRERMHQVEPRLGYLRPPSSAPLKDVRVLGGHIGWNPSPENRPQTIRLDSSGAHGGPLGGVLNGVGNHADLHNPVTFEVDLPRPTRLVVEVLDVSGYGGAALRVSVDGKLLLSRDFTDPDGDRRTESLKQFVGEYGVDIPAGRHTVFVENTGQDWIRADYRFEKAVERTSPPLIALASVGRGLAVAWVRQEERTWAKVVSGKASKEAAPASRLVLPGLTAGRWRAEVWDTWNGSIVAKAAVSVGKDGTATVELPPITRDVAVRLLLLAR